MLEGGKMTIILLFSNFIIKTSEYQLQHRLRRGVSRINAWLAVKGLSTPCFKENQPYLTWDAPYFTPSKLNGHRHTIENLGNKYQQMKYVIHFTN